MNNAMKTVLASFAITIMAFCAAMILGLIVTLCIEYPLTIGILVMFGVIWFVVYKYLKIHFEET